VMENLQKNETLKNNVYIRGKYIKYLQTGPRNDIDSIPHKNAEEEKPKLEDIYIYYERQAEEGTHELHELPRIKKDGSPQITQTFTGYNQE